MNAGTPAEQASRDHAGVVEDEQFVAGKDLREFREAGVLETWRLTVDEQKAGGIAGFGGGLGNQLGRELVVEFVHAHGGNYSKKQGLGEKWKKMMKGQDTMIGMSMSPTCSLWLDLRCFQFLLDNNTLRLYALSSITQEE